MSSITTSRANQNIPAIDSLVAALGMEPFWVGPFEDDITELGVRATRWSIEENDGFGIELMLKDPPYAICEPTPPQHV